MELEKEKGGGGVAKTEDDSKITGAKQMCHTLPPNKSLMLGKTFLQLQLFEDVFSNLVVAFLSAHFLPLICKH